MKTQHFRRSREKKTANIFQTKHKNIYFTFFLNPAHRDLFENGHNLFVASKFEFLLIFKVF